MKKTNDRTGWKEKEEDIFVRRKGEKSVYNESYRMYGDSESCDSTIKLVEFCSWWGVVPLGPPLLILHSDSPPPLFSPPSFPPFSSYLRFDSPYLSPPFMPSPASEFHWPLIPTSTSAKASRTFAFRAVSMNLFQLVAIPFTKIQHILFGLPKSFSWSHSLKSYSSYSVYPIVLVIPLLWHGICLKSTSAFRNCTLL